MQRRIADSIVAPLDILLSSTSKTAYPHWRIDSHFFATFHGIPDLLRDRFNSFKVPRRGDWKSGLTYINAHSAQLPRNLNLFRRIERCTWRLLAISKRCIKDDKAVLSRSCSCGGKRPRRADASSSDSCCSPRHQHFQKVWLEANKRTTDDYFFSIHRNQQQYRTVQYDGVAKDRNVKAPFAFRDILCRITSQPNDHLQREGEEPDIAT